MQGVNNYEILKKTTEVTTPLMALPKWQFG